MEKERDERKEWLWKVRRKCSGLEKKCMEKKTERNEWRIEKCVRKEKRLGGKGM